MTSRVDSDYGPRDGPSSGWTGDYWRITTTLIAGVFVGCTSSRQGATPPSLIETSRDRYSVEIHESLPDLVVPFRLSNTLSEPVLVDMCNGQVATYFEKRANERWREIELGPPRDCPIAQLAVAPGQAIADSAVVRWSSVNDERDLWTYRYGSVPGIYRLRTVVSRGAARQSLISDTFFVGEPPVTPGRGPAFLRRR